MNKFELVAEMREDKGKGASRRLRRAGWVPGIVYGAGSDPEQIQIADNHLYKQLENEAFYSHILAMKLGDSSQRVVLKDLQRHPFKPVIMHMDLQRVDENKVLTMRVPLHFVNEDKCIGVKQSGGVISHLMTELEIVCLPKDLPEYIEVQMEMLDIGDTVHLSDLAIPEGVEMASLLHGGDASQTVVSVHKPKAVVEEVEEIEEVAVEGEPEEVSAEAAEE